MFRSYLVNGIIATGIALQYQKTTISLRVESIFQELTTIKYLLLFNFEYYFSLKIKYRERVRDIQALKKKWCLTELEKKENLLHPQNPSLFFLPFPHHARALSTYVKNLQGFKEEKKHDKKLS